MNMPVITLTVEGMKETVKVALSREVMALDKAVQQAIDDYCTEENINRIVMDTARQQIDNVVKESVREFFGWSQAGRKAIREAVIERLNEVYPEKDS